MDPPIQQKPRSRQSARSESQPGPSSSQSAPTEPSLAERRPRRNVKPPGNWWEVPKPGPVQPAQQPQSEVLDELDEESEDELLLKGPSALAAHDAWPSSWHEAM